MMTDKCMGASDKSDRAVESNPETGIPASKDSRPAKGVAGDAEEITLNPAENCEKQVAGAREGNRPEINSGVFFKEPADEEFNDWAVQRFASFGQFNIDRWPSEVAGLSMPTTLIPLDVPEEFIRLYDHQDGWEPIADRYARVLDEAMGWTNHFIKLNSRSPKDVEETPITCSGKQAISWILQSERCLDDIVTMWRANEPIFICLREVRFISPESEMRCFARDGVMLAVSRYDYHNPPTHEWDGEAMMRLAADFYETNLAQHYPTVVFDLAPGQTGPLLIELNPYGLSDPCCFGSYENIENIGGFAAQAMETRRAETTGSVRKHDSAA